MRVTKRVIPWRRVPLPVSLIVIAWTILFSQMQPSPLAPSSASAVNTVALVDMNGCVDTDGDSFCDEWEIAGGIDLDGDGKIKKHDDAMLPDADVNKPDIYLQYDFMDWAAPGKPCKSDGECQIPSQPNEQCHKKFCSHNHEPDPAAIQMVVDAFAAHGINLHIDPVHNRVPHSQIVTFARAGDTGPLQNGPKAICAGADMEAGVLGGFAVSFHDIKDRYFDPKRKIAYHYALFGHLNTCLTDNPLATVGNCGQCPGDRSTPSGSPTAGSSGIAELPGNDFIVSLAASFNNPLGSVRRNPFAEGGVFMHELGHNLGLHHAGDQATPVDAPNYLSVMNGKYVFSGIRPADEVGSIVPNPALRRLDYSTETLNTLDESALDESAGVSPLSSGLKDTVAFLFPDESNGRGAGAGPIDWNGNGIIDSELVRVDLNAQGGAGEIMRGYTDWPHGNCATSADCPINGIRQQIHDLVNPTLDPRLPCVQNRCQSLMYNFRDQQWGMADAPAPAEHLKRVNYFGIANNYLWGFDDQTYIRYLNIPDYRHRIVRQSVIECGLRR
jgi:hypothetical protein